MTCFTKRCSAIVPRVYTQACRTNVTCHNLCEFSGLQANLSMAGEIYQAIFPYQTDKEIVRHSPLEHYLSVFHSAWIYVWAYALCQKLHRKSAKSRRSFYLPLHLQSCGASGEIRVLPESSVKRGSAISHWHE